MPSIYEFSRTSKMPAKILRHLRDKGLISDPLVKKDFTRLNFLEAIWCDANVVRSMLAQFAKPCRRRLIETADFDSKVERYAYSRYRNQPPRKKLSTKEINEVLQENFGTTLPLDVLQRIRKRAQQSRWREKKRAGDQAQNP
ncbi:hypothetical protein ACHHRT_01550 [Desulfurivibrio sp. D14AmB]|uniref:hypothetical protein n=1 Tax=Desulfurivibrio sp. D14AmB TaxID=3374370 RepID=UPI00376F2C42